MIRQFLIIFSKIPFLIIGLVFGIFITAVTSFALAHGGDLGLIHACVRTNNGAIHIVGANDTCGVGETALDWNIQGIPGPTGSPGPSGSGLFTVVDSNDQEVGTLLGPAIIAKQFGEFWLAIPFTVDGFQEQDQSIQVYYESTDCSGTPLVSADNGVIRFGVVIADDIYYAGNPLVHQYNSLKVFTPPSTYGECRQESSPLLVGPLQTVAVPPNLPPFRIN